MQWYIIRSVCYLREKHVWTCRHEGVSKAIRKELDIFSHHDKCCGFTVIKSFLSRLEAFLTVGHIQHNVLSMGCLENHHWGSVSTELQHSEAEVDYRFNATSSILTMSKFVFSPTKQSPYCHLSSHIVVYGLGEAGEPSSLWNGCAITALSLKVITHISWLFFTAAAEPMGGKWQWSGLPRCCIKPQVGEIALTLQALQITTLSHLNATAISKKTGYIFHHRRGARFQAREAAAPCLTLFLDRGRWSVVKEEHHSSGASFYCGSNWRSWLKKIKFFPDFIFLCED